jgi:hypothetical protein
LNPSAQSGRLWRGEVDLQLHFAVACSNIQGKHEVSTVVSGVMASNESRSDLEKLVIPNKKALRQRSASLAAFRVALEDAELFLHDFETRDLQAESWSAEAIGNAYLELIDALLRRNKLLRFVASRKLITLRTGVVTPSFGYSVFPPKILDEMRKRCETIVTLDDRSRDPLLTIAQNLATMRYEELKEGSSSFTLTKIRKNPAIYSHLLKVSYPSPLPEDFNSYFVGSPSIAIRDVNGVLSHQELKVGVQLDYTPASRFCCGNQQNGESLPCSSKSPIAPFGSPISRHSRDERCDLCRRGNEFVECLSRRPSCDGRKVVCGNEEFAASICISSFGLYITRFMNTLKVGSAFLPNLVGRLLYQGANSALLLYPIMGIETTWLQEGRLRECLSGHLSSLKGFGVEKIQRHAPGITEKLQDFCLSWNRNDDEMLETIRGLLSTSGGLDRLLEAEMKVVSLLKSYLRPSNFLLERALGRGVSEPIAWTRAKGRVSGYRGCLIFLDGGNAIDARKLQGFVFERPRK